MDGAVTLVPIGLFWKAYSRNRLIAQHTVRIECERRARFLGWRVNNPTCTGPLWPVSGNRSGLMP